MIRRISLLVCAGVLLSVLGIAVQLQQATVDQSPTLMQMLTAQDRQQLAQLDRRFAVPAEPVIITIPKSPESTAIQQAALHESLAAIEGVDSVLSTAESSPVSVPGLVGFVGDAPVDVFLLGLAPGSAELGPASRLVRDMERVVTGAVGKPANPTIIGLPQIRLASWQVSREDAAQVLPFLVALTVAVTWLFFSSMVALGLSLLLTTLTTFLCLALYSVAFDVLPALLVIVVPVIWAIATLDAFHLFSRTAYFAQRGHKKPAQAAASSLFQPCLLTTLTTAACFGSLAWFESSPLIASFGLLCCVGTLLAFVLTFTLGQRLLSWYPLQRHQPRWPRCVPFLLVRSAQDRPLLTVAIWLLLMAMSVAGWPRLAVVSAFPGVFSQSQPLARDIARLASLTDTDLNPVDLVIEPVDARGGKPDSLGFATQLTHGYLQTLEETRTVLPLGLLDAGSVSEFANELRVKAPAPGTQRPGHTLLSRWVSTDEQLVRLQLYLAPTSFERKQELFEWIAHFDQTMLEHHRIHFAGPGYFYHLTEQRGLASLRWSSACSFIFLVAAMGWLARDWRGALAALSGCTVPALVLLGVMAWCSIPWSIALLPMPALLLGLMNDDAIHMAWHTRRGRASNLVKNAVAAGPALLATTVVLAAAVGSLAFSGIQTNAYLGVLVPTGFLLALLCNLSLLPALNSLLRR